jgi:hypothetical protein
MREYGLLSVQNNRIGLCRYFRSAENFVGIVTILRRPRPMNPGSITVRHKKYFLLLKHPGRL